jgi:hypothetical protein
LSVNDERELLSIHSKATQQGIKASVFQEPDLNNQVTAITLEPSSDTRKLCSNLPLALKNVSFNKN